MSWDKNTVIVSEIDKTIELLEEFNIKYKLTIIGTVEGYGLNDDLNMFDGVSKNYEIRKLEYKDKVIMEQMIRDEDCDANDYIVSRKFDKSKAPKKWKIEK